MNDNLSQQHLSAETLQALAEGQLPPGALARAEKHLAACARCASEVESFRVLFGALDSLPSLAPSANFADTVMAGVKLPERLPLAARIRAALGLSGPAAHPTAEGLQDFVEGVLPSRQAARIRTHLHDCSTCHDQADAWRSTFRRLNSLDHFQPSQDFAAAVMARVRIPAQAPARVRERQSALAWARKLVPHTRQAWAAISGVALTPAVTLGLVLWSVFSHPTLTPGALLSFVGWKATEFAGFAWQAVSSAALESASLFRVYSLLESLTASPLAVAGLFAAMSVGTVAAVWVLYRNLIMSHPMDGRVAHAPLT